MAAAVLPVGKISEIVIIVVGARAVEEYPPFAAAVVALAVEKQPEFAVVEPGTPVAALQSVGERPISAAAVVRLAEELPTFVEVLEV